MDWPHIGAVMHYSGYMEPGDGAMLVLLVPVRNSFVCAVYSDRKSLL
jgi:hypothetical protein